MKDLKTKNTASEICTGVRDGNALLELARGWLKQGNPIVAGELLQAALKSSEAEQDKELRAKILKEIGRMEMMQSNWESADNFYLEAQRIFKEIEDYQGAAECSRNRANMYFQQGKYEDATEFCEQALEWASIINNYELRATIFNTLGAIKSATGELTESIKIFKLCLADFQSIGNAIRQGYVLLNIGLTQTELKQHAEAVISLNQALAIALEEKDLSLVEICYQNIAKCYMAQDEIHLAKSVLDTARKILPGLNSRALETELNYIDGQICRLLGDYSQARRILEEAFWMAEDNKMTSLSADILKEQALLAQEEGNSTKAESFLFKAIREYNNMNMPAAIEKAQQEMANLKTRKAS